MHDGVVVGNLGLLQNLHQFKWIYIEFTLYSLAVDSLEFLEGDSFLEVKDVLKKILRVDE